MTFLFFTIKFKRNKISLQDFIFINLFVNVMRFGGNFKNMFKIDMFTLITSGKGKDDLIYRLNV